MQSYRLILSACLGCVHCAHQLENIFLTRGGELRLGDFGLALDASQELPFSLVGTTYYMAPEVNKVMMAYTQGI